MKITRLHQQCPKCPSSDGYCEYEDGHGYCFSCRYYKKNEEQEFMENDYSYEYISWRGITRETFERYNSVAKVDKDGPVEIGFPYPNGRTKVRLLKDKVFRNVGSDGGSGYLFGMDQFSPGSAMAVSITEGELDALSAYQMLGSKYPVVSVSSASSAKRDATKEYEYLNSFDKIYIIFDNDEPGQTAAKEVAKLFDFNKVYIVKLQEKDANDYLTKDREREFTRAWWNAKRFLPEGIISSFNEIDKIIDEDMEKPAVPYPFQKLQEMTYGIRTGEFNLITAMEGIGKTEIFRAMEYHLLKTTDANIGMIHLEEGKSRMIKGLVGYEVEQPVHLPDRSISKDDLKAAYRKLTKRDERVHIYTHFGSDDPNTILNTIRFMAGPCGCKYIFLDHITLVVTGLQQEDERKALDYISTKLAMMVEELDFALFIISHVNDDGLTRGSRNISKVADLHLHLDRNITAPAEIDRNTTTLTIRKNRFGSKAGPAGQLLFNPETFMITERVNESTSSL